MMIANWNLVDFIAGATETELAQAFLNDFEVATNVPVRHGTSVCYRVEVAETFGGLDFGVAEGDILGVVAGDAAPAFNAIAVRQNVGTHLVRPGQKRIPFIGETLSNGNNPVLTPAQQANLELGYGSEIEINWVDAQLNNWIFILQPMVIGTVNTGTPENPDYVLDPAKQVPVRNAEVTRITSQVSRKA
jgi:hypothetical protein